MKFHFKAQDGKIVFTEYNRARFIEHLKANDGKDFFAEKSKKPVAEDMREWYWAAVVPMAKSLVPQWSTLTREQVHEAMKKMFNYFDFFNPLTGRTERCGMTAMSDESSTLKAMEFIEKIRQWMSENYLTELPNPEVWKDTVRDRPKFIDEDEKTA